jgi:multiple sugar transport system substrate-binding protein
MFGAYPLYGGKPGFNTAGVARALTWLRTIVKKGYTPVGQQIKEERDLMAKGKIVFKLDGPYFVGILQSLNPALNGDKNFYSTFGVTTVPVGYNGKSQTLADIHQLGIASNSKNKAMDWTFIKYLTSSSDSVRTYMLPQGGVPPLKTEDREPVVLKEPVNRIYLNKILRTMVGGPYTPKYGQQLQIILQALQEAALTSTPISQIQSTTQSALAKTM